MTINWQDWSPLITRYSIKLVGALVVLIGVWIVARILSHLTKRALTRLHFDLTLSIFISSMTRWTIILLGVLACLSIFGVETTSFAAILGAAGLAIGLAFQGSLSNIASGIMLLIFRPLKIGDYVRAGGEQGTVAEVGLFTTSLDTPDNRRVVLPNSSIFGNTIENVTFHPIRRVDFTVGCGYPADIDQTRQVLNRAAESVDLKISDRDHQILLMDLAASSVNWQVRIWANTPDYWVAREQLIRAIKMHLDEAGIEIPYQQIDVHLSQPAK